MKSVKIEKYPYDGITKMYLRYMHDIAIRLKYINSYTGRCPKPEYQKIWMEQSCLQLRIICETIMMAGLVGNSRDYFKTKPKISDLSYPNQIRNQLHKINTDYYPKPMIIGETADAKRKRASEKEKHSLSKDELIRLWADTSDIIHCKNPFGTEQKTMSVLDILNWHKKIVNLLTIHIIILKNFNNKGFLVIVDVFECKEHTMDYIDGIGELADV